MRPCPLKPLYDTATRVQTYIHPRRRNRCSLPSSMHRPCTVLMYYAFCLLCVQIGELQQTLAGMNHQLVTEQGMRRADAQVRGMDKAWATP